MGAYRSQPDKTKIFQNGESKRLSYVALAMCGWRKYMQDAHIAMTKFADNMSLFAVFDGHGGSEVAHYAEKHFAQQLQANSNFAKHRYEDALSETFQKIDDMLRTPEGEKELKAIKKSQIDKQNSDEDEEISSAGCTAVVCLVTETEIYVANAGDSRCILSIGGKVEPMSHDHKPDNPDELARIKKAGGKVTDGRVNGNINLSRALGDFEYKGNSNLKPEEQMVTCKPDILKRSLNGVNYIVMGCDGIFEIKTNQQIIDMATSKKSLKEAGEYVLDALLAPTTQNQYGLDNMSLIIVKIN